MTTLFPIGEPNYITSQISLDNVFRPIHYLGSKLRILDFIENNINLIDPEKGPVCDLFAGSGSVSYKLSKSRPVTSVDIQEYSKVICSALLSPQHLTDEFIDNLLNNCINSHHTQLMYEIGKPLISYEKSSIKKALYEHDPSSLCEIIEDGSIVCFELSSLKDNSSELSILIANYLKDLKSRNVDELNSVITRYYGGIYFSYEQGIQIDCILHQIINSPVEYKDCLLAALISSVSESVNTVGKQFAQPMRPRKQDGKIKSNLGKTVIKDRNIDVFKLYTKWVKKYTNIRLPMFDNKVLKMHFADAFDYLRGTSVIYADPPYTRDHYSRFYHVLETVALYDKPELSKMKLNGQTVISRGLYRKERHQSPFCIKNQAVNAFDVLFSKSSEIGAKLVLSYSGYDGAGNTHPRVVTIDQLKAIGSKYFKNIDCLSTGGFIHSKLNHSSKHLSASKDAEELLIFT